MIVYNKFFDVLKAKGIKQIDLRNKGVHPRTFQKMQRAELIRSDTIDKMCKFLNCQPGDIMAYVPDDEKSDGKKDCLLNGNSDTL